MPKEKSANPVAAQRKADKRKEIAKSKKGQLEQRNEKLARRNPDRVQRQIDELKELEGRNQLRPKDKETLTQLERDLRGITRAREALGHAAPKFASHDRHGGRDGRGGGDARQEQRERRQNLGKRRRGADEAHSSDGSDTDPEVRDIPMPGDTPPPVPRRPREGFKDPQVGPDGQRVPHGLPRKPAAPPPPAQLVYSSAPQLRDLKKEATRFVPAAVRQKQKQVKGAGRLLEPEEIDKLEQAGYYAAQKAAEEADKEADAEQSRAQVKAQAGDDVDMEEQLRRFEEEMKDIYPAEEERLPPAKGVQLEEVDDDGD
ncbi:Putative WW domain binding protein [Septoria linicola]|uniref:WW domain binding protein n=1 Tax=Septoria linicola TaxID=215465 RepID=A0A9Q9AE85_9PEZI|nr:putative WW domain binding protein [Septoria linicola]USW47362.1 Putative WW domain binding protein [Septoria linicola]